MLSFDKGPRIVHIGEDTRGPAKNFLLEGDSLVDGNIILNLASAPIITSGPIITFRPMVQLLTIIVSFNM
jgi:hypothetical protein